MKGQKGKSAPSIGESLRVKLSAAPFDVRTVTTKGRCKDCRFFDASSKKDFDIFDPDEGRYHTTTVSNQHGLGICKWGEENLATPYQALGSIWVPWVSPDNENCPTFEPAITN